MVLVVQTFVKPKLFQDCLLATITLQPFNA